MISTVEQIVRQLDGLNYSWAIAGGCNLYLRNCLQSTSDIDIITSCDGVISIFAKLEKYAKGKPSYSEAENVRSAFFQAVMDGCTIEVMGNPENKINGRWIRNTDWMFNVEHILARNMLVPVTTLDYEKRINQELNNWDRVQNIHDCITLSMQRDKVK
ncbi:MAG: hypothetical protein J0L70_17390 [Leptolyngbya sp. UWPOB_LEPTO1]|uniref:nucleotidyltransferase domain-containing protein n=1 Tax=Leptolyngbya sp. UWPOB_LEPTO1 TaxID=2815653 RepID=UPI001AC39C5D|nr:hypothetical protein [Leptolyngbya sp. UWPOB_LEPTO1]MBN8562307.1 hypothetical protein [Leptolyngbya sp. UWPOB_LEPTO1]